MEPPSLLNISQTHESNGLNSAKTQNTLVMILYILGLILDKVPSILKMMIPTAHVQIMKNKDFGSNYLYSNATYLPFRIIIWISYNMYSEVT